MKNNFIKLISIFTMILVISCNGKKEEVNNSGNLNPEALQDNSSLKRVSIRDGNLVDELYQEIVDKNPQLKKLETELTEFESEPDETQNIFNNYNKKSGQYYVNANGLAGQIKDSLTRVKMFEIIKHSNEKYETTSKGINDLVKEISNSQNSIEDNHIILKLALTIPIIEKYQIENLPKKEKFEQAIAKQKKLNQKVKNITPKN